MVHDSFNIKLKTKALNDFVKEVIRKKQPPYVKGKNLSVKYVAQVHTAPPIFVFFVNFPELFPESVPVLLFLFPLHKHPLSHQLLYHFQLLDYQLQKFDHKIDHRTVNYKTTYIILLEFLLFIRHTLLIFL